MQSELRTAMENPSRLAENFATLSKEMTALRNFRDQIHGKKAIDMKEWLENVESKEQEYSELERRKSDLGKDSSSGRGLKVRKALNTEVLKLLTSVNDLKEEGNDVSKKMEALFGDVMKGNLTRFSHADIRSFTSNYLDRVELDQDGKLYVGQFPDGMRLVVKILTDDDDAVEDIFVAEMKTMFKTSHRNLVRLYGFCFEKNMKALVFEYITNGSLDKILFENHHDGLEWEKLYEIAIDMAKGLSYLHDGCEEHTIHRDLKTSNVLLGSDFSPKITNFAVAKLMDRALTHLTLSTFKRNSEYSAPEMSTEASHITYKCDVYSFGMILFEILGRRKNIQGKVNYPKKNYWKKFEEGDVKGLLNQCGITDKNREKAWILCMVAFWCIQYTPENRPAMDTVVKMLEKEIRVRVPPNPFVPQPPMKSYESVVYEKLPL